MNRINRFIADRIESSVLCAIVNFFFGFDGVWQVFVALAIYGLFAKFGWRKVLGTCGRGLLNFICFVGENAWWFLFVAFEF